MLTKFIALEMSPRFRLNHYQKPARLKTLVNLHELGERSFLQLVRPRPRILRLALRFLNISQRNLWAFRRLSGGAKMHSGFYDWPEWLVTSFASQVGPTLHVSCIYEQFYSLLGSSVVVKRVCSTGRDVISVRCASLSTKTIRAYL